jgi:hypothetical protein
MKSGGLHSEGELWHAATIGAALGAGSGALLAAVIVVLDMRRWWLLPVGLVGISAALLGFLLGLMEPSVGGRTVSDCIKILEGPNDGDKFHAAMTLTYFGPAAKRSVPALIKTLKRGDVDPTTRSLCAKALGAIGPGAQDAVPALIEALKDQDPILRFQSSIALGDIGPGAAAALPALVDTVLKDSDWNVKRHAAVALGKLGPAAREAVPGLVGTLQEEPSHPSAGLALFIIGPTPSEATLVQALDLNNLPISDEAFTRLTDLSNLRSLSFDSATDQNLENIKGLANLQELDLRNAPVTDAGLRHLEGLPKLQSLAIGTKRLLIPCTLSDECLIHVHRLTGLRTLVIEGVPISDAGLESLSSLKELEILELVSVGPKVTDAGIAKLKRTLPLLKRLEFRE